MAIESRPARLFHFLLVLIVVATIAALSVKLYRLHDHAHIRHDSRQEIVWLAPTGLNTERSSLEISNTRWRVNYSAIEHVLWEAQDLNDISNTTLNLLERIYRLLPENLALDEIARLRSLVEKSVLSDKGERFAGWIVNYYHYRKIDQQLKATLNLAADNSRVALITNYLDNLDERQKKYFGVHALTLFKQQNYQTRYFYQRRLVRLDDTLDALQKKTALAAITQDYQEQLESLKID